MEKHMKRFLIPLMSLLVICSCEKGSDIFGGSVQEPVSPLRDYMLAIVDGVASPGLVELESALKVSDEGGVGKYFYETNGVPLTQDGSIWTVRRTGKLKGAKISKVSGKKAWKIEYSGEYAYSDISFPTEISLLAEQADPAAEDHRDWNVVINGSRTEEDGYRCTFTTDDSYIEYKALQTNPDFWNAYGYFLLNVYKNDELIDFAIIEVRGSKSNSTVTHI